MKEQEKLDNLEKKLRRLVRQEDRRIDSFTDDDLHGYLGAIVAFGIEDTVISYLETHQVASVQELYKLFHPDVRRATSARRTRK